ncbi:hypothetical protein V1515DRAFT_580350 [Lipomyces mesembrius]
MTSKTWLPSASVKRAKKSAKTTESEHASELIEEQPNLQTEDLVADEPETKFRYHDHLNEFTGLKKLAPYREPEKKQKDHKSNEKKKRLEWRKQVFGATDAPEWEIA